MDYSLQGKELQKLKARHLVAKKRTEADKIKAVYLLGFGWSVSRVCEALLLSEGTVRNYFNRYKQQGLSGLLKGNQKGRDSYLTDEEKQALSSHLEETTYCNVNAVISYVVQEFEVVYQASGMRRLLKELEFVYKKPEKIPYRVDLAAQKAFVASYVRLKNQLNQGDSLYFMDATHPEHTSVPSHGWIKRGTKKVLKSNPRPYRLNINGAINIDTLNIVIRFEESINKETTKDFLETLRAHQSKGRIYLVCDNAGYYQSPEVQALAKAMAIELVYLPAYSPNLNLIERLWKFYKKRVLYNKYYSTFSEMVQASRKFFESIGQYHNELKTLMTEKFQTLAI